MDYKKELNVQEPYENKSVNKFDKRLLYLLLLPILLLLFYLAFLYFTPSEQEEQEEIAQEERVDVIHNLEGEVYLTLSPLETQRPNIYRLSLPFLTLEPLFEEPQYLNYMAKPCPERENLLFVRAYEDNTSQILLLNKETEEITEVTSASEFFERNPVFSSDGEKITYWIYEGDGLSWGVGEDPEDNSIYVSSLSGEKEKVANGVFPLFTPDDENIIFIKNDGLYSLNLTNDSESKLMPLFTSESIVNLPDDDIWGWANLRVNYSEMEKMLIITDSANEKSHIFELESLIPFNYQKVHSIDTDTPNWPVFYSGGDYMLMQEFETVEPYFPIISFWFLGGQEPERILTFSLEDYDIGYIWLTDWITK